MDIDELIKGLRAAKINISEKVENIFRDKEIDGSALVVLSKEKLEGVGIPVGPAAKISSFIKQIN